MIRKNNKMMKVSAVAAVMSIGLLTGGYTLANKNITLVVEGNEIQISTLQSNVKDVLEEQNVKYDENDIISLPLNQNISNGDKIEVINVTEKTIKENEEVPFEVEVVEDENLLKGNTEVEVEGQPGNNELLYKVTYHNGKQVEKKFIEEIVVTEPVNEVVKKGTKVELEVESSKVKSIKVNSSKSNNVEVNTVSYTNNLSNENTSNTNENTSNTNENNTSNDNSNRKHMSVVATAYTGGGITSTGTTPKWGTIAVDPSVIPYGTKIYIPQFDKTFIAEDCGSAIKGNKIDIYMNDEETVKSWGRKTIDIYIVG